MSRSADLLRVSPIFDRLGRWLGSSKRQVAKKPRPVLTVVGAGMTRAMYAVPSGSKVAESCGGADCAINAKRLARLSTSSNGVIGLHMLGPETIPRRALAKDFLNINSCALERN